MARKRGDYGNFEYELKPEALRWHAFSLLKPLFSSDAEQRWASGMNGMLATYKHLPLSIQHEIDGVHIMRSVTTPREESVLVKYMRGQETAPSVH